MTDTPEPRTTTVRFADQQLTIEWISPRGRVLRRDVLYGPRHPEVYGKPVLANAYDALSPVPEHVCGLQGYQRGSEPDPVCPACAHFAKGWLGRQFDKAAQDVREMTADGTALGVAEAHAERLFVQVEQLTVERDTWKDAVLDALVVDGIYTAEHDADPRKAIHDLLQWEATLALDPAVSEEAAAWRDTLAEAEQRVEVLTRELAAPAEGDRLKLNAYGRRCYDLGAATAERELLQELALTRADVEAAAGELAVPIYTAEPGTEVARLLIANVMLRAKVAQLLQARLAAEPEAKP